MEKEKREPRPTSLSTHPDAAAVRLNNVARDGKSEAGAALLTRASGIDAVEALKDALLIGGRNADAGVFDALTTTSRDSASAETVTLPPAGVY